MPAATAVATSASRVARVWSTGSPVCGTKRGAVPGTSKVSGSAALSATSSARAAGFRPSGRADCRRFVWIHDTLPYELADTFGAAMEHGPQVFEQTVENAVSTRP
ncbi:hypothetical protein [Nocardia sp. NPDC052112]|uniref:hypothetical protein n=1 Tax=Nocardia sp. NPDC052112 TaxID=3155646 RepID=UPI0034203676